MIPWHLRGTLRFRLALGFGAVGALLLAAFSATLYFYVVERMARPLDHQLRRDQAEVERRLRVLPDGQLRWDGHDFDDRSPWTTHYPWFEVWDENGRLVRRCWPFSENRVQQTPVAPAPGLETISVFSVAPDVRLRVLSLPLPVAGREHPWMLRLMRLHEPVGDAVGALRWIIFLALPVGVACLIVAGYVVARRWLSPLDRMARDANHISADNLGQRLTIDNPHDEAGQLGTRFNQTLDRLEASFNALDQFVADASHELRTPLTTLRSVGEVGLRRSRSVEEYREIIGSMLEEAERLQQLVGRLLELATAESGAADVHRDELALDEFVRECIDVIGVLAEARNQRLVVSTTPCFARTDPLLLRQALQNLVDNAVKFSPPGSTIRIDLTATDTAAEIAVADEGPGITAESQAHLTERFFRALPGRGRSGSGFGLGLALTKAYMRLLNGSLHYASRAPGGSVFRLVLPRD